MRNFEKHENHTLKIDDNNQTFLGIPLGLSPLYFRNRPKGIDALLKNDAILYTIEGEVGSWKVENYLEYDGEMYISGEWIDVADFKTILQEDKLAIQLLHTLACYLKKKKKFSRSILIGNFFWSYTHNALLIFSDEVTSLISEGRSESFREQWIYPFSTPISEEFTFFDKASYFLASLYNFLLTKKTPFPSVRFEEIRPFQRGCPPVFPNNLLGKELLENSFDIKLYSPSVEHWITFFSELPPSLEKERSLFKDPFYLTQRKKQLKNYHIKHNLFKKRFLIAGVGGAILFAYFLLSPILRKALAPPITLGLTKIEVTELYFDSLNSIDGNLMQEIASEDSQLQQFGKGLTNIYVINKTRSAYTHYEPFLSPVKWISKGSPPFKEGQDLFGVLVKSISPTANNEISSNYLYFSNNILEGESSGTDPSSLDDELVVVRYQKEFDTLFTFTVGKKGEFLIDSVTQKEISNNIVTDYNIPDEIEQAILKNSGTN